MRLFDVVVPGAVERELTAPDGLYPGRVYPDAALFQELRSLMRDPPEDEPQPLTVFGGGEAAAIALAQLLQVTVLLNDRRAAGFARNLGLAVLTIPDTIVLLCAQELIPDHMARAMLAASERHGAAPALVAAATQVLDLLIQMS